MKITINQALDKISNKKELNKKQKELKDSLLKFKFDFGGRTVIDNSKKVLEIINEIKE